MFHMPSGDCVIFYDITRPLTCRFFDQFMLLVIEVNNPADTARLFSCR